MAFETTHLIQRFPRIRSFEANCTVYRFNSIEFSCEPVDVHRCFGVRSGSTQREIFKNVVDSVASSIFIRCLNLKSGLLIYSTCIFTCVSRNFASFEPLVVDGGCVGAWHNLVSVALK